MQHVLRNLSDTCDLALDIYEASINLSCKHQ